MKLHDYNILQIPFLEKSKDLLSYHVIRTFIEANQAHLSCIFINKIFFSCKIHVSKIYEKSFDQKKNHVIKKN